MNSFGLYLMAGLYVLAGLNHFRMPRMYVRMMPAYLPWHRELVYLSGLAEILLGILLIFPATRVFAAWGVIALLIAVFPANVFMYRTQATKFQKIPSWILLLRLPLQAVLMYWAYTYTSP